MAAMSTKPVPRGQAREAGVRRGEKASTDTEVIAPTVIFEDAALSPLPIRDPKSASLIFRPAGQGCFP
jgi:hypothetical protein